MQNIPNIIIINTDQLRSFTVGCYGNESIQTPNIDQLAAEGVRFEQAISNNPVCVAARSVLLSGQYSRTCTGALGNAAWSEFNQQRERLQAETLPEVMRKAGYRTAAIGKWHIDPAPSLIGFDYSCVSRTIGSHTEFIENERDILKPTGFVADNEIKKAREFVNCTDDPFFLYFNIQSPHMPLFDAPFQYTRMYDKEEVPLRKNVYCNGELPYDERWFQIYMWQHNYLDSEPITAKLPPDFDLKDLTALYYGLTTWTDDIVGHIIDILKDKGIYDNTMILFTSDHGDNLGSHGLFNKDNCIEEAVRIPFIMKWSDTFQAGTVIAEQQAGLIDVFPTLVDLIHGEIPDSVQGRSLAPVLFNEIDCFPDNYAFIETAYHEIGIRTPDKKLIIQTPYSKIEEKILTDFDYSDSDVKYFDLLEDPDELHNIQAESKHTETYKKLETALIDWNTNTPWLDLPWSLA